jgi:15-cis-phytoene synthase
MIAAEQRSPLEHCVELTRREGTSFYLGIRLLPRERRAAMCAVYALARRIDDIADGDEPAAARLRQLDAVRDDLAALDRATDDPVMAAVADVACRHDLPLDAFGDLIDGARMDVLGTRYAYFDDLVVYGRRVAGSIGRLSVGVFGARDRQAAMRLADDLGVAMQVVNILRDVGEDLARDRVYLPAEDLRWFGCEVDHGRLVGGVPELIRFEASRARAWFRGGLRLLPLLDRPSATSVAAMTGTYERLLEHIERRPWAVLDRRLELPAWERGLVAARSLARGIA